MHAPSLCKFRTAPLYGKVLNYRFTWFSLVIVRARGRTEKASLCVSVPLKAVGGIYL
jgi:hypothetical protein